MVGEDVKCPRCGRLILYGKKCPKCGLLYDEAIPYRQQKRKRRGIIATAAVCVIISILLLAPIVMMSKGDPTCHWTIRRKVTSPADESSIEILKKRFAKGELSKEEYLEMKTLLGG